MMTGVVSQANLWRMMRSRANPSRGSAITRTTTAVAAFPSMHGLVPILAQVDLEALALQHEDQQVRQGLVVFNHQNGRQLSYRRRLNGRCLCLRRRRCGIGGHTLFSAGRERSIR